MTNLMLGLSFPGVFWVWTAHTPNTCVPAAPSASMVYNTDASPSQAQATCLLILQHRAQAAPADQTELTLRGK